MEVVVEDQGIPPEAVRKAIEVQVWRNQYSPAFSKTEYNVDVPEMTQYATTVLTVTATDLDEDRQQDVRFNTHNDEIFLYKPWNRKGFFSIWNHHKWLSQLFLIHLNTCVMGLRSL